MNDLDARLTAALNADAPPARDARFRVEVLMRLERARFRRRVGLSVSVAAAAAVLTSIGAPTLDAWVAWDVWRLAIVAAVAAAGLFAGAGLMGRGPFRAYFRRLAAWALQPWSVDVR